MAARVLSGDCVSKCLQIRIWTRRAPGCCRGWMNLSILPLVPEFYIDLWYARWKPVLVSDVSSQDSMWNKWSFIIQFDSEGDRAVSNICLMVFPTLTELAGTFLLHFCIEMLLFLQETLGEVHTDRGELPGTCVGSVLSLLLMKTALLGRELTRSKG